jgi:hypothetical protein
MLQLVLEPYLHSPLYSYHHGSCLINYGGDNFALKLFLHFSLHLRHIDYVLQLVYEKLSIQILEAILYSLVVCYSFFLQRTFILLKPRFFETRKICQDFLYK